MLPESGASGIVPRRVGECPGNFPNQCGVIFVHLNLDPHEAELSQAFAPLGCC